MIYVAIVLQYYFLLFVYFEIHKCIKDFHFDLILHRKTFIFHLLPMSDSHKERLSIVN